MNQKTRAYIYRILCALALLAGGYGLVTDAKAVLWLGVGGAVLGNGLAAKHTDTKAEDGAVVFDLSLIVGFIGGLFLGFLLWHR